MRKAICICLCLVMCLSLVCCKSGSKITSSDIENAEVSTQKNEEISLLYSSADSLNPYTSAAKHNREVSHLLYDSLIVCDGDFNPVYKLASKASLEGNVCTVKLRTAYFSDGSPVTAEDVLYSYNIAKKSDTVYAAELYEVASVSASGSEIVFTLKNHDDYFLNLLDFPIIKASSDGKKNSDGVEIAPIGAGRYYMADDTSTLLRHNNYYGEIGAVSKIKLIDAPDDISATHYVEIGAADIYYADEALGNVVRMSGKRADVNTNNFVYIGINSAYGQLSNSLLRYAISSAINRTEICHSAYFDNATPASGYFNPGIKETSAVQTLKTVSDTQISVENLSKLGYNKMKDGYYCNDSGNHITLTLLVNSDNLSRVAAAKLIASECKQCGIEINVIERSYPEYISLLSSGGFQLYLGEIKVLNNMDLESLVVSGGSAAYGVSAGVVDENTGTAGNTVCGDMVYKYKKGECTLTDLAGAFLTEMPQIPVCYRKGMLFYTSRIKNKAKPSCSDIFFSFENYIF